VKACFVGQRAYFEQCSLLEPAGGVEPFFVDHRGGADPSPVRVALDSIGPDVVVVFRPETLPPGFLRGVEALTLGFNTEPIPRDASGRVHPEQAFRLSELAQTDASQFDRIITFDPMGAATAESAGVPVWRSVPLPVADHLFAASLRPPARPPRIAFVGYSTAHREQWLTPVKHEFDVLHVVTGLRIAAGLDGSSTRELWGSIDVGINLHVGPFPSFENRVCLHLAAGHLVVSEPLEPSHGLEPGIDYVQVRSPAVLRRVISTLHTDPDTFRAIRIRGHAKSSTFRASSVYPRLLRDFVADVRAFGTSRGR
jgi:hypothetical protein